VATGFGKWFGKRFGTWFGGPLGDRVVFHRRVEPPRPPFHTTAAFRSDPCFQVVIHEFR